MNVFTRFWNYTKSVMKRIVDEGTGEAVPSSRVSTDNYLTSSLLPNPFAVVPPQDHESFWRIHDLDVEHLDRFSPQELLDMLIDISPEISKAAWDFQRFCNPGFEVKVYKFGEAKTESEEGKAHIKRVMDTLKQNYGSVDVVIGRFFLGAFLRGGFTSEIVFDASGETVDLVAPDPYSIRFRLREDPVRGKVWEPGQFQSNKFVSLEIPTFSYIPIDPAPASPYGRSIAAPSLFTSLFLLGIMHDIKRVIMQQGYKRMDIEVDVELAMDTYSFDSKGYNDFRQYLADSIDAIKTVYSQLQPDDAFIHTNIFKFAQPAGTVDSDSIGAIDKMTERLEKMITRGLKSNGLVMDTSDNRNEADSNRRWEIHAAGVKSLQHFCETMLEKQLNLSLRARGIPAWVEFRFSELRASEMFRDEQTKAMRIQNARNSYEAGYTSQNEASNYAVNHDADVPEPRKALESLDFQQDNNAGNEIIGGDEETRIKEMFSS